MSKVNRPKVFYFTNIAPHYREEIWKLLANEAGWDFHFVFGDNYAQSKISQIDITQDWIELKYSKVKNISIKGILIWQKGVIKIAFQNKIDLVILLGEMNVLSNWLLAIMFRIRGIKVYFWGHGFSGNESNFKKLTRIIFNRLAQGHFLYGQRSRSIMKSLGFKESILHVVNNSLSYSFQCNLREKVKNRNAIKYFRDNNLPLLVFIGRLSSVKRLDVLLDAFSLLNANEQKFNLLFIGDGVERKNLESKSLSLGYQDCVHFFGSSHHEETNAKLLASADLCVSPGNVGLTAVHCLTYGTPCGTHNDFSHQMPEFESIKDGVTGFFFERNNAKDLANKIERWFNDNGTKREEVRQNCYQIIDKYYNPEIQLSIFKKIILNN